jgi:hypothetical protein
VATRMPSISGPSGYMLAPPRRRGLHPLSRPTATHRQSWRSHAPQNSRHLRVSHGSSTNTRSQPNSIPRGQPSLWRSLVTKGEQSCLWRIVISPISPQDSSSCYYSAKCNLLVVLIHLYSHPPLYVDRLYIHRCPTGTGRNCGIRAIVGLNGPKNDADAVERVTVNA